MWLIHHTIAICYHTNWFWSVQFVDLLLRNQNWINLNIIKMCDDDLWITFMSKNDSMYVPLACVPLVMRLYSCAASLYSNWLCEHLYFCHPHPVSAKAAYAKLWRKDEISIRIMWMNNTRYCPGGQNIPFRLHHLLARCFQYRRRISVHVPSMWLAWRPNTTFALLPHRILPWLLSPSNRARTCVWSKRPNWVIATIPEFVGTILWTQLVWKYRMITQY